MKVVSLFSGAGGLDLGLHEAGHDIIMQCESDPGAQQVLKKLFPGTHLVSDVCSVQALPQGTEMVAAGFPCSDVSRAGHRTGLHGQATSLIHQVFRLLDNAVRAGRPVPWVLLENVEGMLDRSGDDAPVVQHVAHTLECLGYMSWAHRIVDTAGFGIPHRRRRVLLVASYWGDARDVLLTQGTGYCNGACQVIFNGTPCYLCRSSHSTEDPDGNFGRSCTYTMDLGSAQSGPDIDLIPTMKTSNNRMCLLLPDGRAGTLRINDAERLQGFPEGCTLPCYPIRPPGIAGHLEGSLTGKTATKQEAYRWALLGNAVSVPVAAWVGRALMEPLRLKYVCGPDDHALEGDYEGSVGTPQRASERVPSADLLSPKEGDDDDGEPDSILNMQFDMVRKAAARKPSSEQPAATEAAAWPRAAWYVKGMGRYSVRDMSEAPLLTPLQPLPTIVTELGPPPSKEAILTYLARLRERGFNTHSIEQKLLSCGISSNFEGMPVGDSRKDTKGLDTLGTLAWARVKGVWWPAEVLDPWHMPATRKQLPDGAVAALSHSKRRISLPGSIADGLPCALFHQHESIEATPEEENPMLEAPGLTRGSKNATQQGRHFLAILIGNRQAHWLPEAQLQPFQRNCLARRMDGEALIEGKKLSNAQQWRRAVNEASRLCGLLAAAAEGDLLDGEHVEALAALSAARASAANLRVRCGRCEACRCVSGTPRRCLVTRCCAAAASGHSGAQLAVLGETAIGARVKVWWKLDAAYYSGVVESFDPVRHRHTVFYDDGDVESIPLWAPNQLVCTLTPMDAWPEQAARLAMKRAAQQDGLTEQSAAKRSCKAIESGGKLTG